MYLRSTKRKNKNGTVTEYLQFARNERNPETSFTVARIVHSFGRADQLDREVLNLNQILFKVCDMKKVPFITLLTLLLFSSQASADNGTFPKGAQTDHPCLKIKQSCLAAGFVKGGAKEGKGLQANCEKPIMEGKMVTGVSVDAATVQACRDKKNENQNLKNK